MDWKDIVGSIAPVLGTALGGPFGGMAGKFLASKLGVEEDTIEALVTAQDPETLFKIKSLDAEFKLEMKRLGIAEKQLHADDRANARKMATATTVKPQVILACIYVTGFMAVLYVVFAGTIEMDATQKEMANYLLGILSYGLAQIMNFFFGSSAGSKEKTAHLGAK